MMPNVPITPHAGRRELTLLVLLLLPLVVMLAALPAIPQDPAYHALADTRTFFGIPNALDVVSNAGFLLVGLFGLSLCLKQTFHGARPSWAVFFAALILVTAGSGYYHSQPDDYTLAWDRLPMTLAFMALLSALVAEHLEPRIERRLLPIALAIGLGSIAWWQYADDLRLYAWVQFGPIFALVYLLTACRGRYSHRHYLVVAFVLYALAKAAEFGDSAIFAATRDTLSGHTLKHLLASAGALSIYVMLRRRERNGP